MKKFNKFIITLSATLFLLTGSLKAETLADIEKELNDLRESISSLDVSTVEEAIIIDKSLKEVTKAVDFVNEKVKEGEIDAAVAAINFADKIITDIASSVIPKEIETEVIKKGEEYTPEKLKEVTEVTSGLDGNKEKKTQKLAQDILTAQNSGLDTFAIAENVNEFGINTINAKDIIETVTKAQQANSLTALKRVKGLSSEIADQERFSSILGTDPDEVNIYLRQAEVIRNGDPKGFRAIEIEKYGRAMGLSKERINQGVRAVKSGDWETEKQVAKEIYQAAKSNPNYTVSIEITDTVMNDIMKEDIAIENVVYGVMNSKVFGELDLNPYLEEGVAVTDVEGWINAQNSNSRRISDFADKVGDYMKSSGAFSDQTIRSVKHTINYNGPSGRTAKTISSMVMRDLQDDNYKSAYNAVDSDFMDLSKRGTESYAREAARIEAQLNNDYYKFDAALGAKEVTKLTASEKDKLSKVYNEALDYYYKKNANLAVKEIETSTILATESAAEVVEAEAEMEEYNKVLQEKLVAKETAGKKYKEVLELQKKGEATLQESVAAQQISGKALADFHNAESEAGKIKRKLAAAKTLASTTKNKLNMSTTNAAQAGFSVELIENVVINTSEKTFEAIIEREAQKAAIEAEQIDINANILAPRIGYDNAARIAKNALKNNTTLKHEALKTKLITEKEYSEMVNPTFVQYTKHRQYGQDWTAATYTDGSISIMADEQELQEAASVFAKEEKGRKLTSAIMTNVSKKQASELLQAINEGKQIETVAAQIVNNSSSFNSSSETVTELLTAVEGGDDILKSTLDTIVNPEFVGIGRHRQYLQDWDVKIYSDGSREIIATPEALAEAAKLFEKDNQARALQNTIQRSMSQNEARLLLKNIKQGGEVPGVVAGLNVEVSKSVAEVATTVTEVSESVTETAAEVSESVTETAAEVSESVAETAAEVSESVAETAAEVVAKVSESVTESVAASIDVEELTKALEEIVGNATGNLTITKVGRHRGKNAAGVLVDQVAIFRSDGSMEVCKETGNIAAVESSGGC